MPPRYNSMAARGPNAKLPRPPKVETQQSRALDEIESWWYRTKLDWPIFTTTSEDDLRQRLLEAFLHTKTIQYLVNKRPTTFLDFASRVEVRIIRYADAPGIGYANLTISRDRDLTVARIR